MDESVQEVSLYFFLPLIAAYLVACGGWWLITRWRPETWPPPAEIETDRPYLDVGLTLLTVVLILLLGQAWRAGLRVPRGEVVWLNHLAWMLDNLIIFSPLFIVLALRRQRLQTVYLSGKALHKKLAFGIGLGTGSVLLFLLLRGELERAPEIFGGVLNPDQFVNFFPVFLEGVALAFAFVRIRWAFGLWPALLIPALLFALAHVPNSLAADRSLLYIITFFIVNTSLVVGILYVVQRAQDIIWLGLVHYLMDIAIEAF